MWPAPATWGMAGALSLVLLVMPWMPPLKRIRPAEVYLDHCNGCARCAEDCPFSAIQMVRRTDGLVFQHEAQVDADLCTSCGICAGACPTSTPFRRRSDLSPGIDLPDYPLRDVRDAVMNASEKLSGDKRILVFACNHTVSGNSKEDQVATIRIPCVSMIPPSFIDYALNRDLADGILLNGCRKGECHYRFGPQILEERIARERDPGLPRRVSRDRVKVLWASKSARKALDKSIQEFSAILEGIPREERRGQTKKGVNEENKASISEGSSND
jgi:coenzyme F420-reducing hydrogenase delta subunit/ferredoxin